MAPAPNTVTVRDIRVPVLPGDIIGETILTNGTCGVGSGSILYVSGDPAVGSTTTYAPGAGTYPLAATLEADVDKDGFGDESQDACLTQATAGAPCDVIAPDTRITVGKRASRNGKVSYEFTATEAAKFECRLEGGKKGLDQYQPCTSPTKYSRLKPGKYKFFVRAIDPWGNTDLTPAKRKVRVLPKR